MFGYRGRERNMKKKEYWYWFCEECETLCNHNKSSIWCDCGLKYKDIDDAPFWWALANVKIEY